MTVHRVAYNCLAKKTTTKKNICIRGKIAKNPKGAKEFVVVATFTCQNIHVLMRQNLQPQ